jgi:hypothetical protein
LFNQKGFLSLIYQNRNNMTIEKTNEVIYKRFNDLCNTACKNYQEIYETPKTFQFNLNGQPHVYYKKRRELKQK